MYLIGVENMGVFGRGSLSRRFMGTSVLRHPSISAMAHSDWVLGSSKVTVLFGDTLGGMMWPFSFGGEGLKVFF